MNCIICNKDNWQNVEEYKLAKDGLSLCLNCGFVTYEGVLKNADNVKEFYREEYRKAPTAQNLFSGERKLHFHDAFLRPTLFKTWGEKKKPVVFDVGAAIGMFLTHISKVFPGADVYGNELTLSFRRVAFRQYGLKLTEDFDASRKYDLISSYKVAEHIPKINEELEKYHKALKDDGHLYISVPCWFDAMTNFGLDGFNIQYYYHKNHINLWTKKLFETLLAKHGFKIIHSNHVYYDSTYLCVKDNEVKKLAPQYEQPGEIISIMSHIRDAAKAFDCGDFEKAIECYPNFPTAHIASYEKTRNEWHKKGFAEIEKQVLERMFNACPNSAHTRFFAGDVCSRYDEFEKSVGHFNEGLKMRPNNPLSFKAIASCFRAMAEKDPKGASKYLTKAIETTQALQQTSAQDRDDAISFIFADSANLPMPGE